MSRLSTFVIPLLSLGVGLLSGFGFLFMVYRHECHTLLNRTNDEAVSASGELREQYQACLQKEAESQRKCQDTHSQTLEAHSSLATQHQNLLEKAAVLQRESDGYLQTIQSLQEQIKRLNREMGQSAVDTQQTKLQAEEKVLALQQQLELTQNRLQQKTRELDELETDGGGGFGENVFTASKALSEIKSAIQRQSWAQFLFQYNSRGPFQIKFEVDTNEGQLDSFVVEFSTAETFSMTVRTALSLVEAELYVGTTIRPDEENDALLTGGNPHHTTSNRVQSNLKRRFAEYGFGMEPFLWVGLGNDAVKSCERSPGAFWFPSKGPQFSITMPPNNKPPSLDELASDQIPACHGRIVQGMSFLQQFFARTGQPPPVLTIASAQVLVPDQSSTKEEL